MDCHVPPRIAYWTSAFEPAMEAVASEVALLRKSFPSSVAWGLHPGHSVLLSLRRGFCLNPRLHLLFRLATRILEPVFQLNHVFGSVGDWFYLQGARRRPTVLTVTSAASPVARPLLDRVGQFVVEHPGGRDELARLGIANQRIRLIFPPVDLQKFTPAPAPPGPFTVLFASSPDQESWLSARGVPQLLDAAAARPRMQFRLLWRPWGNSPDRVRSWIAERGLTNVELRVGCSSDMPGQYRTAHVTAAPFTDPQRCKPVPNSLIESMACGRPVLMTESVGLAEMVTAANAGRVSAATGDALAEQLDQLQSDWEPCAANARRLAERWFSAEKFVTGYRQLYAEILSRAAA
jgi:glycosyltransferase involved in cell wall biosynthesis